MGYSVHLLRVLGPLTFDILPVLIPGYTDHSPEGFRLRSIVFGACETCVFGSSFLAIGEVLTVALSFV